ncbi:MAG: hypothetical protein QXW97_02260 [Candidatus Pacearchaeota archaeon]
MMQTFFETELCIKCKGKGLCKKPCKIYLKIKNFLPKIKTHFSGKSPPEIFVGKYNYPNISAGILSSTNFTDSEKFSYPEIWHKNNFSINEILINRSKLIYGKFETSVKETKINKKLLDLMQEISMAYKSVSTEFFLKKPPKIKLEINKYSPLINNQAHLQYARLQENPKIKPKVDYIVQDSEIKATDAIIELYKNNIEITNINKILSAGLLGLKTRKKLVPTRWAITAVDDIISKSLINKIRFYPEINEICLFNSEYNGNHYEILLLPEKFSFEVIEVEQSGSLWNQTKNISVMQDYEYFSGRDSYAKNVTGAYYANRLALCEYLEKIKKQACAIFMREVKPEYYAPLGVGILREITRKAFNNSPEKFDTIKEALNKAQQRLKSPISIWTNKSVLLKEFKKQTRLNKWF